MDKDIVEVSDNDALAPRHERPTRPRRPRPPELPEHISIKLTRQQKAIIAVAALIMALISFFPLGDHFSSVKTYAATIAALDDKLETVTSLMAGSTGTSAAISLLPGDAGTPIAEKLVDLSSDFLIVLSAIYLEKYLLTILGFVAFKILIPIGLLLFVIQLFVPWYEARRIMLGLSTKLAIFGLAIAFVVPVSVWVSSKIEATYQESINQTISDAEQTVNAIENEVETGDAATTNTTETTQTQGNPNVITQFVENITGGVSELTENARTSLNRFVEALAVLIVTSCVIPILVLLFFLWLVRTILGIEIHLPMPRSARGFTNYRR